MATQKDRPGSGGAGRRGAGTVTTENKNPAPAPVDLSEESVAGEEDPGASEDLEEPAFNRPPPKKPATDD
jgi:hypothetical protein